MTPTDQIAKWMKGRRKSAVGRIIRFMKRCKHGIALITGPMRSGKSNVLLEVLRKVQKNGRTVLCVKPANDSRATGIRSRSNAEAKAHSVKDAEAFLALVEEHGPSIVFVDETQFTSPEMHQAILHVAKYAFVIVATLDLDFRGDPFEAFATLAIEGPRRFKSPKKNSYLLVRLTGVCQVCDAEHATHSKLLAVPPTEGRIRIGDEGYLTVCETCHTA